MNINSTNSVVATSKKIKVANKAKKQSNISIPCMFIPDQDLNWAFGQKPSVLRLFLKCWQSDRYGSRWMQLNHDLKRSSFMEAKKILSEAGGNIAKLL